MHEDANTLSIDEIVTFAYCSMQYHLRYRHNFPWYPTTPEMAFNTAIRKAFNSYFGVQMLPARRQSAMEMATKNYVRDMQLVQEQFPEKIARVLKLRAEGLLALGSIYWYYNPDQDMVIASQLPYMTRVTWGNDSVYVKGDIDALIMRHMHNKSLQTAVVMDFSDDHDYHMDHSILGYVKRGWARYIVREGVELGYDTPLHYQNVPVHRKEYTQKVTLTDTNSLRVTANQVDKGIQSGVVIASASPQKCKSCPYLKVCRPTLASTGIEAAKEQITEIANRRLAK